jgi:hypothetical protein
MVVTPFKSVLNALLVPDVTAYIISSGEYFLASFRFPPNLISEISFAALASSLARKNADHPLKAIVNNDLAKNSPNIRAAKIGILSTLTAGISIPAITNFGLASGDVERIVATDVVR